MNILGVSCYYHDAAACLLQDGKVVAAAQEERFTRKKNSADFPVNAINYCIEAGDISFNDIDYIGFYEKPFLKFYRAVVNHLSSYPFSLKNFLDTMPIWLKDRLIMPLVFKKELGFNGKTLFIKHHLSHAASAFLVSPFEEAAILTADALGEWATTTCGIGRGCDIQILREMRYPHSLGLLYTAVTTYLGFEALRGEGKVMGLAAYGEPTYLDRLKEIVTVRPDGSFRLDERFFGFNSGSRMYSCRFVKAFGKARCPEDKVEQRHRDMAASLQALVEEIIITIARNLYSETRMDSLCLAGGVFLNCLLNRRLLEETPFKEVFIQPAAGDSGGALGAASYIYHSILKNPRTFVMRDAYLGPEFSKDRIRNILNNSGLSFKELIEEETARYTARLLSEGKAVGWFQGRMEWGPRALGNRSILADPRNPAAKEILNSRVKKREPFRPYAPAVLEEKASEFFELECESPFMLLAPRVREEKRALIPGATHVDGTARVQTVSNDTNPRFRRLIEEFEKLTGVPILINTSFNLRGEPIACTPEDAISCFKRSDMDSLVLEDFAVER
ncbi:MAG: carbamoyltransferase [Candidatus Omnitrophica bacterium]|nr:carbamoyltransferase [Candidatus Omnitrophota bacterium]